MTTNLNNTFDKFFGESLKRSEEILNEKQNKKQTKKKTKDNIAKHDINYKDIFDNFFGSVMK